MPSSAPEIAVRVRDLMKAYKDVVAVNGIDLEVARRRVLRPARTERRGQDDHDRNLRRSDDAGRRRRRSPRHALGSDARRLRAAARHPAPGDAALREAHRSSRRSSCSAVSIGRGHRRGTSIALVQLEEKRDARVGTLSGGQKQRLALACALVGRSRVCCFSTSRRPASIRRRAASCGT